MPNTNFQTFHQMGQAINEVVRQATGRDNVQNIDMEHITVAQNHYYQDVDVSGPVVSFHAGAVGLPLEKCVVQIEPVQEGSGDTSPDNVRPITGWTRAKVTRTGKNLIPMPYRSSPNGEAFTTNGITFTPNDDGTITIDGTATANAIYYIRTASGVLPLKAGTYTMKGILNGGLNTLAFRVYDENGTIGYARNTDFTFDLDQSRKISLSLYVYAGYTANNEVVKPMLVYGSTSTDYEPYHGETYDITFPSEAGTVYGGTLDVVSGVLTVDKVGVIIDSTIPFNASTSYPGSFYKNRNAFSIPVPAWDKVTIICSHAKRITILNQHTYTIGSMYIDGSVNLRLLGTDATLEDWNTYVDAQKTNGTPVTIVYNIETPITYQLTPTEITTLLGVNNIWADTGDIEVKFADIKELY